MRIFSSLAFALVMTQVVHAQFGTREHGTSGTELLTDAALATGNARIIMTGFTDRLSPRDMLLVYTSDPAGGAGSTVFGNIYTLFDGSGNHLVATPVGVRQLQNGNFFMVGNYYEPNAGTMGVYMARFTGAGAPILPVRTFMTTGAPDTYIEATAITHADPISDKLYITGNVDLAPYSGTGQGIFAAGVTGSSATLNWSKVYGIPSVGSLWVSTDIIQDRVAPNNLYIVGHGALDALLMTVTSTTGALVPGETFLYDITLPGGSDERIYAIDKTNTPGNFVVAGTTDVTGGSVLAFRVDLPGGLVTAQTNIPYSGANSGMRAHDVRSRVNKDGRQEFFICATASPGVFGLQDMVVLKRTTTLNVIGEYSYATGRDEVGLRVLPDAATGMMVFGTISPGSIGQADIVVTKAYRNGVHPCDHQRVAPPFVAVSLTKTVVDPTEREALHATEDLTIPEQSPMSTLVTCSEVLTVLGGDNKMTLADEPLVEATGVLAAMPFPNPLPAAQQVLNLPMNSPIDQVVHVSISDLTGRIVMRGSIAVGAGASVQPLNLPKLPSGIYALELLGEASDGAQVRFAVE